MARKPKPVDPTKKTHRTTISLPTATFNAAKKRMEQPTERPFYEFSDYVAWLIRRDVGENADISEISPSEPGAVDTELIKMDLGTNEEGKTGQGKKWKDETKPKGKPDQAAG